MPRVVSRSWVDAVFKGRRQDLLAFAAPWNRSFNDFAHNEIEHQAQYTHYHNGHPDNFIIRLFSRDVLYETNTGGSRQHLCRDQGAPTHATRNADAC